MRYAKRMSESHALILSILSVSITRLVFGKSLHGWFGLNGSNDERGFMQTLILRSLANNIIGSQFASLIVEAEVGVKRYSFGSDIELKVRCLCGRIFFLSKTCFLQRLVSSCPACSFVDRRAYPAARSDEES